MLAIVAPGQGSQVPGMFDPWLSTGRPELAAATADRLAWFAAVTGVDLVDLGTQADEATIRDTAVAQPLLVAAGLLAAEALVAELAADDPAPRDDGDARARSTAQVLGADLLAGHSVGELTVAALSGALSVEQALVLVTRRGAGMAAAAAARTGGMTAVLGGDPDEVREILARHGLVAANSNGGGQIVAAGDPADLDALAADPPPRARLRPLVVAGAFHTAHMASAVDGLALLVRGVAPDHARPAVVSNSDGAVVEDGPELLRRIVAQVARPVRWDACQQTLADAGVTGLLELAPAGTLTGLARRGLPGVATFALRTPADLPGAAAFVREHSARRRGVGTRSPAAVLDEGTPASDRRGTVTPGGSVIGGTVMGGTVMRGTAMRGTR